MMRMNERRANFKKTLDEKEGRRRREETTRQIRKNKKEEQLQKRRMGCNQEKETSQINSSGSDCSDLSQKKIFSVADIPELAKLLKSFDSSEQDLLGATRGFRRILSVERDPPVDAVLNAGVLPYLVKNLTKNPNAAKLIFETAWALTNIASTSQTNVVVEAGATRPLIQLLQHNAADVREQAAWCLGNIAGDNTDFRDQLLHEGVIHPLLLNIYQPDNMSLLNNVVWTISNLCRGKPAPDMAMVESAIDPLVGILYKDITSEVQIDVVWALSYLSDGPNEKIDRMMKTDVTPKLVEYLEDKSSPVLTPTIRCLGNFVTGSDIQTQAVLDAGILKHLTQLLRSSKRVIRKETCWLVSNITAGTEKQITSLMRQPGVMTQLVDLALEAPWETRKEALWALSNICTTGNEDHVMSLVQCEGLQPLAEALALTNIESTVMVACLDAIESVMKVNERHSNLDYTRVFDEYDGLDYLENLQQHQSNAVYEKAVALLESYFGATEDEDENLAPATDASGVFAFGIAPTKELFSSSELSDNPAPMTFNFGNQNQGTPLQTWNV